MHDFHGLWQYPYCSINSYPNILVQTTLSPASTTLYVHTHSLPHPSIWQIEFFFLLEFLVRFGQRGDNQWELLLNTLRKRVNSTKTSIPSTSFAIILFLWSLFYCFFFYSHDKNHGLLLIQFLVPLIFLIFVCCQFPDWFLLLLSLNFYFSQFGLVGLSCTSF